METLKELLAVLGFGPDNIQAVLYISLAATMAPQVLKRSVPQVRAELIAVVAGSICGAAMMPDLLRGALVGAVLGSFWTVMYKPLMRIAYKKWPELEDKVSAKPTIKRDKDGNIGVKVGEDKTLWIGAPSEPPDDTVPKEGIKPEPSNE